MIRSVDDFSDRVVVAVIVLGAGMRRWWVAATCVCQGEAAVD